MNNNASTPSTSSSLLRDLLSRPSTSSAPATTIKAEPPSASSTPAPTIEADPVVVNLASDDDMDWTLFNPDDMDWMLFSTAHPNFDPSNPEHIDEAMCNVLPPSVPRRDQDLPPPSFSLVPPPLSPVPSSPPPSSAAPSLPTPSSPTPSLPPPSSPTPSPPSSPTPSQPAYQPAAEFADRKAPSPTSLPQRKINARKICLDMYYEVWRWERTAISRTFYLYNLNYNEILKVSLPLSVRPSLAQRQQHLFESPLYLRKQIINGRKQIALYP